MSTIINEVNTFVTAQNVNRGQSGVALDFNALTGAVPAGDNGVTGISGITAGATTVSLGVGYNAVILDGAHSTTASTSGTDSYSFNVQTNGAINILDNNTGQSVSVTGASYLLFNSAATNANGSYQSLYFVEASTNAQIASMYNAAFLRQPDLPGLEFYAVPIAAGTMTLHQAATYFLASPEFQHDYPAASLAADNGGPNDQAFIAQMYENVLHRAPAASESAFYVSALQGTLPGVAQETRADLLINFSLSPENQALISGWMINMANGPYADSSDLLSAQTLVTDGVAAGYINTALVAAPTSSTYAVSGNTLIYGAGYVIPGIDVTVPTNEITVGNNNIIVSLSNNINVINVTGVGDTVYGAVGGGSDILLPSYTGASILINNGGTVYLYGTGNTLFSGGLTSNVTTPATVYGFTAGDFIRQGSSISTMGEVLTGSSSNPIKGANILFFGGPSQVGVLGVNVGSVADDTAATMAAAANAVYKVGDVSNEDVVFFGQDPSGNTIVYHWMTGDINHDHLVDANAFTGAEILVGVPASSITASMFGNNAPFANPH